MAEVEYAIGAATWEAVESGIRGRGRLGDLGDWETPKIGEFGMLGDSGNWEKRGIQGFGRLGNSGDSEVTKDCSSGDWSFREIGRFGD